MLEQVVPATARVRRANFHQQGRLRGPLLDPVHHHADHLRAAWVQGDGDDAK